jgi:hypothetical protein
MLGQQGGACRGAVISAMRFLPDAPRSKKVDNGVEGPQRAGSAG